MEKQNAKMQYLSWVQNFLRLGYKAVGVYAMKMFFSHDVHNAWQAESFWQFDRPGWGHTEQGSSEQPHSPKTQENGLNWRIRYMREERYVQESFHSSLIHNWEEIPGTMKLLDGGTNCSKSRILIPFHLSSAFNIANKELTLLIPLLFANGT